MPKVLSDYLALPYRLEVTPSQDGGYFLQYPELPGCFTQVDSLEEIGLASREILEGWLEIALEMDDPIPDPFDAGSFSGKFLLRIPKSLHRTLSFEAQREEVSLNQYAVYLLSQRDASIRAERRCLTIERKIDMLQERIPADVYKTAPAPSPGDWRESLLVAA